MTFSKGSFLELVSTRRYLIKTDDSSNPIFHSLQLYNLFRTLTTMLISMGTIYTECSYITSLS